MSSPPPPSELLTWALSVLGTPTGGSLPELTVVAGDASHRRYFRAQIGDRSYVLVDSPPDTEKNEAFLVARSVLEKAGLKVPTLYGVDLERGFLVLEDLGDSLLLAQLNNSNVDEHYRQAMGLLLQLNNLNDQLPQMPAYDGALLAEELSRFPEWFVQSLLGLELDVEERAMLQACFDRLIDNALDQPGVLVHRDFHSRNLMPQSDGVLAVIDFQDAVLGPVTYDLVSLLRDCYVSWPAPQVDAWALAYRDRLRAAGRPGGDVEDARFLRWFDLMGLQRHIKVLGTFARLYLRDGKSSYLDDLPLVIDYVMQVSSRYATDDAELGAFYQWFQRRLSPVIANQEWSRST